MKLSKNFSLQEFLKSDTAMRLGIKNIPGEQELVNLTALASCILQPVRDKWGSTKISSGLRVLELNRAIKSGDQSQHVVGQAADFEAYAVGNFELATWISETLDFDQLILEYYTKGIPDSGWIHCSYSSDGRNRKECLTKIEGKEGYEKGLLE